MLTADLVDARRSKDELLLRPLDEVGHEEALTLARSFLDATKDMIGRRREELEEAWDAASTEERTSRFKLAAGLKKLIADECTFEAETAVDPVEVRRVLFTHAAETRKNLEGSAPFNRDLVMREVATKLDLTPEALERAIFSDLKSEHLLREAPRLNPEAVVEAWELGQAQAVLIAATEVRVHVMNASAGLARAFFAKLKFHKLLFRAMPRPNGFELIIDGPYSMFDSVTKYGVRLACLVPALRALENWKLEAKIKWGKNKDDLVFRLASADAVPFVQGRPKRPVLDTRGPQSDGAPSSWSDGLHLSDDVRELIEGVQSMQTGWTIRPATVLLESPASGGGQTICIPDLELTHPEREGPVYVEILGYWSRDAVWKRVEIAKAGLDANVVFVVSSRLRVSEEVLEEEDASCLYVYKGKMSVKAILDRAEKLVPKSKERASNVPLSTKKKRRSTK